MTAGRDVDRLIAAWLRDEASGPRADYLRETLAVLDHVPQSRWSRARGVAGGHSRSIRMPRRLSGVAVAAVLSVALLAGLAVVGAERRAPLTGPAGNGLIAYGDGQDAFVVDPFGDRRPVRLPEALGVERNPTFSQDGTMIAYASFDPTFGHHGGPLHLFVVPADGSAAPLRISADVAMWDGNDVAPTWAPDRQRVAYTGFDVASNTVGIVVARVDGSGVTMVAPFGLLHGQASPVWSPDGQWIAYRDASDSIDNTRLMLVRGDGMSAAIELTNASGTTGSYEVMSWSPDSRSLAYARRGEGVRSSVVAVLDIDGARERVVSPGGAVGKYPIWSSDGAWIAYLEGDPGAGAAARTVLVDPTGEQRRDLGVTLDCDMAWSPDSRFLVGLSPGCVEPLVIVPVDDPSGAMTIEPGGSGGTIDWQRTAP